jgi:hypothetical protein
VQGLKTQGLQLLWFNGVKSVWEMKQQATAPTKDTQPMGCRFRTRTKNTVNRMYREVTGELVGNIHWANVSRKKHTAVRSWTETETRTGEF